MDESRAFGYGLFLKKIGGRTTMQAYVDESRARHFHYYGNLNFYFKPLLLAVNMKLNEIFLYQRMPLFPNFVIVYENAKKNIVTSLP